MHALDVTTAVVVRVKGPVLEGGFYFGLVVQLGFFGGCCAGEGEF